MLQTLSEGVLCVDMGSPTQPSQTMRRNLTIQHLGNFAQIRTSHINVNPQLIPKKMDMWKQ